MASTGHRKYYRLSDLSRSIGRMIEKYYTKKYWVKAEIAKLNYYPKSGHCYPDLVEKAEGRIKVQMRATIWRHHYQAIRRKFEATTHEELKSGLQVLFLAELKYDGVHGLSLNITDIDPSLNLGAMAKEKMECIARLKKEKIFDLNRNLHLPLLPKRLAIISVSTSKGYQDFLNILDPVKTKYGVFHMLFPALLQGDNAIPSIIEQLHIIERVKSHFDAVLIIRGGGGDVGLHAYNNYDLARTIATFPLPVLTGIGHASNETVSDMVAYKNVITPTELAYYILEKLEGFEQFLFEVQDSIVQMSRYILETNKKQLEFFKQGIFLKSRNMLQAQYAQLASFRQLLPHFAKQRLRTEQQAIALLTEKIQLLSPENVLQRGYSITFHRGKVLYDASRLKEGDEISTQLSGGQTVKSVVKSGSEE